MKCYQCHEHGHLATNYPHKKKNKKVVGAAASEALASQFELDFSLIACMASSALGYVWYLIVALPSTRREISRFSVTWRREISKYI